MEWEDRSSDDRRPGPSLGTSSDDSLETRRHTCDAPACLFLTRGLLSAWKSTSIFHWKVNSCLLALILLKRGYIYWQTYSLFNMYIVESVTKYIYKKNFNSFVTLKAAFFPTINSPLFKIYKIQLSIMESPSKTALNINDEYFD